MHVDVTVDIEGERLVAIKTATGADAVARLGREAARLAEARHPGVVDLLGCRDLEPAASGPGRPVDPVREMRMGYAGEPLTRWTGSLADVAGVAASVASTLADLHDAGIVHGRVDASHVLLGGSGHPRLCGWVEPADAARADDVAAWGRLLDTLVARTPARRRRGRARGGAAARRALLAVADRATDPVATRRPPARVLADAVVAAVPTASLPHGRGPDPDPGLPPRPPVAPPEPDALERIWSYPGEPSEDERWAAALGPSPAGPGRAHHRLDDPPLPAVGGTTWSDVPARGVPATGDDADDPGAAPDDREPDDDAASPHAAGPPAPALEPPLSRDQPPAHEPPPAHDQPPAHEPPPAHIPGPHEAAPPVAVPGSATHHPAPAGGRRRAVPTGRAAPRGTAPVGPGGRTRGPAPGPRPQRRHARLAALVAVAVVGAAGVTLAETPGRGPGGGAGAAGPVAGGAGCGPAPSPAADVDGDGCPEALAVSGSTVGAGDARWTLGQPGDIVALGDWDCDGQASAALLRPPSGDVFVFPTWAGPGEPVTVTPLRRVVGAAAIRAVPSGSAARPCDRLVVDRRGDRPETVAVPR